MSQQKSPHEDFIMTFLVVFIVGGLAWIIWYFFSKELTEVVRWIRVGEFWVAKLMYGDDAAVYYKGAYQEVKVWYSWFKRAPVEDITTEYIHISSAVAMEPLKILFISLMSVMAVIVFWRGPGTFYRRRMGLEGLMKEQAKSFPTIAPFLKFDPRKLPYRAPGEPVPAQLPLFSEALTPEEWLAYHEVKMLGGGAIDKGRAYQALTLQLGKRWQGARKLPIHMQGIYAACALKHKRKRQQCDELMNAMAKSWTAEKGFSPNAKLVSEIRKVIKDPKIGGALEKFADQHAYETTALLRCLQRAREEGGVLAPAQFVWLRGHDRTLWYPLNNLGRKSYHAEASGAMVHYTNELIAGQRIPTPRFDEVINAFETYIKTGGARSIPDLDKSAQKTAYWKK